jgi:hypothetical protein
MENQTTMGDIYAWGNDIVICGVDGMVYRWRYYIFQTSPIYGRNRAEASKTGVVFVPRDIGNKTSM